MLNVHLLQFVVNLLKESYINYKMPEYLVMISCMHSGIICKYTENSCLDILQIL